jgi:hypothetical protein
VPALLATELTISLFAATSTIARSSSNHDQAPLSLNWISVPATSISA